MPQVKIERIEMTFPTQPAPLRVLGGVDLVVSDGEIVTIVGPSGCGKSTLINIVAGLAKPTGGTVAIDGNPVRGIPPNIGMVFQNYSETLLPWKTVYENIELPLITKGYDKADRKRLVEEHLDLIGLRGFENHKPYTLSGGMQQRVAFARSLVYRPGLLLMDEPFGALDAQTRIVLQEDMLRILKQQAMTSIIVTHDIHEAVYLGDRVVILSPAPSRADAVIDIPLGDDRYARNVKATQEFVDLASWVWERVRTGPSRAAEKRSGGDS